jgi:hypothetical protein
MSELLNRYYFIQGLIWFNEMCMAIQKQFVSCVLAESSRRSNEWTPTLSWKVVVVVFIVCLQVPVSKLSLSTFSTFIPEISRPFAVTLFKQWNIRSILAIWTLCIVELILWFNEMCWRNSKTLRSIFYSNAKGTSLPPLLPFKPSIAFK